MNQILRFHPSPYRSALSIHVIRHRVEHRIAELGFRNGFATLGALVLHGHDLRLKHPNLRRPADGGPKHGKFELGKLR